MSFKLIVISALLLQQSLAFAKKENEISKQYVLIEKTIHKYQQLANDINKDYLVIQKVSHDCEVSFKNLSKECSTNCNEDQFNKLKKSQLICHRLFATYPKNQIQLKLNLANFQSDLDSKQLIKLSAFQQQMKTNLITLKNKTTELEILNKELSQRYLERYKNTVAQYFKNEHIKNATIGKKRAFCKISYYELDNLSLVFKYKENTESTLYWYDLLFKTRLSLKLYHQLKQYCPEKNLTDTIQSNIKRLEQKSLRLNRKVFITECKKSIYEDFYGSRCESITKITPQILVLLKEAKK